METLDTSTLLHHSPQLYFKRALALLEEDNLPDALQCMDAAIVFSHHSPFYIYQKIRLLYQLGAMKNCSQLIVSQLEYLYKHGSLYILCRLIDYFQKINHYNTDDLSKLLHHYHIPYCLANSYSTLLTQKNKPFLSLAQKAMFQDDYNLCLCYCELYLKLHPTTSEICLLQATAHHMLGHLLTAKNYYLEYLKLCPNHPKAFENMGLIAMELGEYDLAIDYLQKAVSAQPQNISYLLYLGECYSLAKKLDAAIATYEQVTRQEPNNLQSYFNLAHTYKRLSKNRLSRRYTKFIKKQLKNKV